MPPTPDEHVAAVVGGDRRALARLITTFEENRRGSLEALAAAFAVAAPAYRVGITGSPGTGKSTLTNGLIGVLRSTGERVAVLAVDPTSPFSGGAVLGDRVRMQDHALDDGVYVRSMASRGHLGGLSASSSKALVAMEAAGFAIVLIETVGVGQDEVEVASTADTVVVVVTPGWGDGIQAAKAGILEIGHVFVVNKADRPGTPEAVSDLRSMLELGSQAGWVPPILETVATTGEGVAEVWEAVVGHREYLGDDGLEARRRLRRRSDFETALVVSLHAKALAEAAESDEILASVESGAVDPWSAASTVMG